MYVRDLFVGGFLLVGAAWIAASAPTDAARPAFGLAVLACALAGVTYLLSGTGTGLGEEVAGTTLTRVRFRAISQALLGVAMVALGVGDYLIEASTWGAVVASIGILVVAFGRLLWTREADREAAESAETDREAAESAETDREPGA